MSLKQVVKDLLKNSSGKKLSDLAKEMGISRPNDITDMLAEGEIRPTMVKALSVLINKDQPEIINILEKEKEKEIEERRKLLMVELLEENNKNLHITIENLKNIISEKDKIIEEKNKIIDEKNNSLRKTYAILEKLNLNIDQLG